MTIKALQHKAHEIVAKYFYGENNKIHNVTTVVLVNNGSADLFFSLKYFVNVNGKNYFGDVNCSSESGVLDKFELLCKFEIDKLKIEVKKQEDVEI